MAPGKARSRIARVLGDEWRGRAFILHVGGNQWYKNRAGVIDVYAALVARYADAPMLVMAGKPLTPALDTCRGIQAGGKPLVFDRVVMLTVA